MVEGIEYTRWDRCLRDFNRRNRWRPTHLTVLDDAGAQEAGRGLPLVGVSLEKGCGGSPRIHIMLEERDATHPRQQTFTITNVKRLTPNRGRDGRDESLEIEDDQGEKNLLRFEPRNSAEY
jgi:hypothetical protein